MRSVSEYLNEVFDKPYRFEGPKEYPVYGRYSKYIYNFKAGRDDMRVEINSEDDEVDLFFTRNGGTGTTGDGDQYRIFATVMEVLADFVKRFNPKIATFSAELVDGRYQTSVGDTHFYFADPDDPINKMRVKNSRFRLYKKMIKRYTKKMGYKSEVRIEDDPQEGEFAHFKLTRIR